MQDSTVSLGVGQKAKPQIFLQICTFTATTLLFRFDLIVFLAAAVVNINIYKCSIGNNTNSSLLTASQRRKC